MTARERDLAVWLAGPTWVHRGAGARGLLGECLPSTEDLLARCRRIIEAMDGPVLAAEERSTIEAALRDGLQRRVWDRRRHPGSTAVSSLAGRTASTYRMLVALVGHRERPWVCVGDGRTPGCGMVFDGPPRYLRVNKDGVPTRDGKDWLFRTPVFCDWCHDSPLRLAALLDGDGIAWSDHFDPACRRLAIFRRCPGCEGVFVARRANQMHCGDRCRKRASRSVGAR